jgi:hypothetical protein
MGKIGLNLSRCPKKHWPPARLNFQLSMDNPGSILLLYSGIYSEPRFILPNIAEVSKVDY